MCRAVAGRSRRYYGQRNGARVCLWEQVEPAAGRSASPARGVVASAATGGSQSRARMRYGRETIYFADGGALSFCVRGLRCGRGLSHIREKIIHVRKKGPGPGPGSRLRFSISCLLFRVTTMSMVTTYDPAHVACYES